MTPMACAEPPRRPHRRGADHRVFAPTDGRSPAVRRDRARTSPRRTFRRDPRQPADGAVEQVRLVGARDRQQERVRRRLRHALRRHGRRIRPDQGRAEDARLRARALAERAGPATADPRADHDEAADGGAAADQLDTDSLPPYEMLDPIIEAYVEDDLDETPSSPGGSTGRRWTGRADDRSRRVQATAGRARGEDHAEGVRARPPPADHQPLRVDRSSDPYESAHVTVTDTCVSSVGGWIGVDASAPLPPCPRP